MAQTAPIRNAHLAALAARHAELETRIAMETTRPNPDQGLLASLKKAKLQIKDMLATN